MTETVSTFILEEGRPDKSRLSSPMQRRSNANRWRSQERETDGGEGGGGLSSFEEELTTLTIQRCLGGGEGEKQWSFTFSERH